MGDIKSSIGCDLWYIRYLNTIATQGGNGWQSSCRVAEELLEGSKSAATFGGSYSRATQNGKLFPDGDSSIKGITIPTQQWSIFGGISQDHIGYFMNNKEQPTTYTSRWIEHNISNFGFGTASVSQKSWQTFSTQSITRYDIEPDFGSKFFTMDGYAFQFGASIIVESLLAINKDSTMSTLPDGSRNIGLSINLGIINKNVQFEKLNNTVQKDPLLPTLTYIFGDFSKLIATGIDYTTDSNIARLKWFQEQSLGKPEITFKPSATSDQALLLSAAHFSSGTSSATQREQFSRLPDNWQYGLLLYHVARTAVIGIGYASINENDKDLESVEKEVLAPSLFSSTRNILDLLAIYNTSSKKALAWHFGIGAAMLAAGALSDNLSIAKAGMDGLSATTWKPNPTEDPLLKGTTQVSGIFNALYSRKIENMHLKGTRGAIRVQRNLSDGPLYTATILSAPQLSRDDNKALPTSNDAIVGTQIMSGSPNSIVRIKANAGIGGRMENSDAGLQFGAVAEVGTTLSIQPSSWSIDLGVHCAATKYGSGYDTECGFGVGLTR